MGTSAASVYTGPGSPTLNLKTASPSNPASMFSTYTLCTIVGRGGGLGAGGNNNNQDDVSYLFGTASGNGTFTCRVRYIAGTSSDGGYAGAGLMVRTSLANDARNVAVMLTDGNGVTFQWRSQDNGPEEAWPMSIAIGVGAPIWVRLNKHYDTFTVSYSQDGVKWYNPTSVAVAFGPSPYYVGIVATTHDPTRIVVDLVDRIDGFTPHMYASIQPTPQASSSSSAG
jgi:regulation of enolase protein 1 (concanavalin A-like superfamily)